MGCLYQGDLMVNDQLFRTTYGEDSPDLRYANMRLSHSCMPVIVPSSKKDATGTEKPLSQE